MTAAMCERQLDIFPEIDRIKKLHGNMAILARLNAILNDPNAALSDAERLINTDAALGATIIRLSNSVLYAVGERRVDVYSALQKVGFNEALRLVGIALSREVFMRDLHAYGITAWEFWRESFFTASLMEVAARQAVGLNRDRAYLIGLLHGIGKVVINEVLLSLDIEILWDNEIPAHDWEDVMIGSNQAEVGALLLEKWAFPSEVFKVVGSQLDANAAKLNPMVALLQCAIEMRGMMDSDLLLSRDHEIRVPDLLKEKWITEESLRAAAGLAREQVMHVARTLRRTA